MTSATVITDASFCSETRAAGWAAYIRIDGVPEPVKAYAAFREPLINSAEAELLAAVNGLWLARQHGAEHLLLQTDCLAVVHLINRKYRGRRWKLHRVLVAAFADKGLDLVAVTARHVKGHSGVKDARSYVNRWCDRHAKAAMRGHRKQLVSLETEA